MTCVSVLARERILQELATRGGSMPRSVMIRKMKIHQFELDPVLEELDQECKIKRIDIKVGKGKFSQIIEIKDPELRLAV
jgi:hypothetical protein